MSADEERWPPPNTPEAFESLCRDVWEELWGPGCNAQKNGRSGQPQAGVDVYGWKDGRLVGVQCKQKDGLLRTKVTIPELEEEVKKAGTFEPALSEFILATTGPADEAVQRWSREITLAHEGQRRFTVEVWDWNRIWAEIYRRLDLRRRLAPTYWPAIVDAQIGPLIASSRLTHSADRLFGREKELVALDAAWADPKVHVVTLVAWGGVGKTSLAAYWAATLAARGYGSARYFDWSFYSQGTKEQGDASADTFVAAALRFFGDPELAASPASAWDKGARLARLVSERKTLLILDGLEPLQYPPSHPLAGELKDPAIQSLLKGLAQNLIGLCLVTTREGVKDLTAFRSTTAPEWGLERLSTEVGVHLLEHRSVWGSRADLESLVEKVAGHALTLQVLGTYLAKAHGGDVRRQDRVKLEKADSKTQGGHAFKAMAAYERWLSEGGEEGARQLALLRLLGLFDRPADAGCVAALRKEPAIPGLTEPLIGLEEDDWNFACSALASCSLLAVKEEERQEEAFRSLDAHPLLREYFARQLREQNEAGWRAAHGRLFEHLRDTTERLPDTLEGLQSLYQAVAHGCLARRQQEACTDIYRGRIQRGEEYFSTFKLGAIGADLGAVACFFDPPWSRVSPVLAEYDQAWLLNEAAFSLRSLGRLTEALEPLEASLGMRIDQEIWVNAARIASNLSELRQSLGDLAGAVRGGEQSVTFSDRSENSFLRINARATLADVLHQAGRRTEALKFFSEAERIQAEEQPKHPHLYSFQGFRYCDLLLAEAERAAWGSWEGGVGFAFQAEGLREVEKRGLKLFEWRHPSEPIGDIAHDHLTLGRARFYRAILEGSSHSDSTPEIEKSVAGLRRAGTLEFVARCLLTRAWHRHLKGDPAAARADLDAALDIAERGPMPLHLADIHLYRARIFHDRDALAAARVLIEKHGYWRRKEELEDAEEWAKGW